jgi:hypothetical protein
MARALRKATAPDLPVAQGNEGQVDDQDQPGQRHAQHVGQQHGNARHAAVDEVAGKQKPLQSQARREDTQYDQETVVYLFFVVFMPRKVAN